MNRRAGPVAIAAAPGLRGAGGFGSLLGAAVADGFLRVPWPRSAGTIEQGVQQIASRNRAAAALVVLAASDRPLESIAAGPVVAGVPVGIVPVGDPRDFARWLDALRQRVVTSRPQYAILAMWKPFYLEWGRRFSGAISRGYGNCADVRGWFADETTREELSENLGTGPDLVIYIGHGRRRGWSGYRGVRWSHLGAVAEAKPAGIVVSLSCDNLKVEAGKDPAFGIQWLRHGRAIAFFGAVKAIADDAMVGVAEVLAGELRLGNHACLGSLLVAVDARLRSHGSPEMMEAWNSFRTVGDPSAAFA